MGQHYLVQGLLLLSLVHSSLQETRQYLECSRPVNSEEISNDGSPVVRIRIASIYGNQIEPGTELPLWSAYSDRDFCHLHSRTNVQLPTTLLVPCTDCPTCDALSRVIAHNADTSFVVAGTELQPYWFDHVNKYFPFCPSRMPGRLSPPFLNLTRHGHHHRNRGWASNESLMFPFNFDVANIPLFFVGLFLFFMFIISITAVIYITRHLRTRKRRMNWIYDPSPMVKTTLGANERARSSLIPMDLHNHLFLSDACRHALVERYRTNHCGPAI
ncbi:hypothetical protein PRIPAC_91190 [Pristionchus pacificus]|uniref:Uncharacterized protein n=1 Tax=Pristionchus pacificus TaxID=54126 RepID=A0A2A6CYV1_PRIPA|nr:hypothetical protein PRIPAC_91190 [Pristionchus pacificus]|eukprot:PDM83308.1 hypothetical protein PRIPAC_34940 [Pristionchus pacificus]